MSLDFNLIEKSIEYSERKLLEKQLTQSPDLYLLEDFLYPPLLNKVCDYITTVDLSAWAKTELQEHKPRMQISWVPNTVIEEIHLVMEKLTDSVNNLFAADYKFNGINIWRDSEYYTIARHSDNRRVAAAIQIYLNSGPANLNTSFYLDKDIISTNYKENFGYVMNNVNYLKHGMTSMVPKDFIRYSMYTTWTPR